jgi:hypothetical protein
MHLNIAPRKSQVPVEDGKRKDGGNVEEPGFSFDWKKVKWVILGLIMPEFVSPKLTKSHHDLVSLRHTTNYFG